MSNSTTKLVNPMKVITGKDTRWSYANVWEAKSINGGTPKFSVSLIIPKSDTVTVQKIKAAIQAAYEEGQAKLKGNGRSVPPLTAIKTPLRDGDTERPDDPAYANSYFNVVHYGYIEKFIESLGERFNIREIAFDRWGAVQMVQNLEGMGFTVVPFGQGFKDMSPPTKELMKLVLEQRIAHGGHPVLRWMMDNIFIRTDPAGNIKPDKEKSTEKIDGAVATIMALDRAIRCGNDKTESVYDSRGLLFI